MWWVGCQSPEAAPFEARLGCDSSYVDFGATTLGVPVSQVLKLGALGPAPVEITGVQLEPNDTAFLVPALPPRLASGRSTVPAIVFRPTEAGQHVSVLRVSVRDGPDLQLTLAGRGVDARAVSHEGLDLGRPDVGSARAGAITLHNDSETPVPALVRVSGPDAAQLSPAELLLTVPAFSDATAAYQYRPTGQPGHRDVSLEIVGCPLCAPTRLPVSADAAPRPAERLSAVTAVPAVARPALGGAENPKTLAALKVESVRRLSPRRRAPLVGGPARAGRGEALQVFPSLSTVN